MKLVRDSDFEFLSRNPISGIFYVRKSERGRKPLFESTGESKSKYRAKEIALDLIAKWKGDVSPQGDVVLFRNVAALVVNNKKNLRQETRDKYENQFKVLLPYMGDMRIDQIDEQLWEQFVFDRCQIKENYSFATTLMVLRDVINRAFERKLIDRKPKFRNPDKDRESSGRVFSQPELYRIAKHAAPKSGRHTLRRFDVRHAIILANTEAFRRGDVTKLSWDRIDLEDGTLRFTKKVTKNKTARTIPLEAKSLRILKRRKALIGNLSPWVFPSPGKPSKHVHSFDTGFKRALTRAKIQADPRGVVGRFHDIRRSALTRMFKVATNHLMVCFLRDISVEVAMKNYIRWTISELKGWAA